MEYVRALIDKASKVCGSDQELADRIGTARPNISLMRAGKRAISPATAAELADIAGVDIDLAVKMAVLESVKGTRREAKLREILGKGLTAGAVAMLATSYSGAANATSAIEDSGRTALDNIYIVSIRMLRKLRKVGAFSQAKTGLLQQWLLSHLAARPL